MAGSNVPGHAVGVPRSWSRLAIALLAALLAASCGNGGSPKATVADPDAAIPTTMQLTSAAFAAGASIPARYSCDGAAVAPPLTWSLVPNEAVELAVTVTDPDAPGGTFVHWVLLGLSPAVLGLADGAPPPATSHQAAASSGRTRYVGMCPPKGQLHRYRFTVYALRQPDGLANGVPASRALATIRATALARGTLTGTFGR
jgi:Raf kinase inhibitor-like YbhB/YbcL family protein